MQLIKYISNTKLWKLGIWHTVVTYKWKYYSWEWRISLFGLFNKGKFVIYNKKQFKKDCLKILSIQEIPDIDMTKYWNLKLDGYNCIEIYEYIYKQEGMKKVWFMKRILLEILKASSYIFIFLLWIVLWLYLYHNYFSISEKSYLEDRNNIEFSE